MRKNFADDHQMNSPLLSIRYTKLENLIAMDSSLKFLTISYEYPYILAPIITPYPLNINPILLQYHYFPFQTSMFIF